MMAAADSARATASTCQIEVRKLAPSLPERRRGGAKVELLNQTPAKPNIDGHARALPLRK